MDEKTKTKLLKMTESSDAAVYAGDPDGIKLLRELVRTCKYDQPLSEDLESRLVDMAENGIKTHGLTSGDSNRGNKIAKAMHLTHETSGNRPKSEFLMTDEEYEAETMPTLGVVILMHKAEKTQAEAIRIVAKKLRIDRRTVKQNIKKHGEFIENTYLSRIAVEEKSELRPSKLDVNNSSS